MHDYRYDQWNDVLDTKEVTERHLIPSEAPYTIKLNEVPVKTSPSSLSVKIIEPATETFGTTFTEVAVTPSVDAYMPDYYSEADSDENWNTGSLLFNVGNAGQEVSVTYTAQGSLNSVLSPQCPAFWMERGDGSDGILLADTDMTLSGLKQYKSVYIASGVTVTVDGFLDIRCQGAFINYGTINATGGGGRGGWGLEGYPSSTYTSNIPPGMRGEKSICGGYGGAGYGSNGSSGVGVGNITVSSLTEDFKKYAMHNNIICNGGGGSHTKGYGDYDPDDGTDKFFGANGGNGGGFIRVIAKSHYSSGTYTANGNNGSSSKLNRTTYTGGGGGGGVIIIIVERNLASGSFTHTGGTGYASGGAGWHEVLEIGGEY